MSCVVLEIELADINAIDELGVFIDGKVQGYSFRPPTNANPQSKQLGVQKTCTKLCGTVDVWIFSELPNILPSDVEGENFAKGTEKCMILGILVGKEIENLEDHGCDKDRDLFDGEMWICSSYPFRHKTTLHWAQRKAKLFGNWIMHHLKL